MSVHGVARFGSSVLLSAALLAPYTAFAQGAPAAKPAGGAAAAPSEDKQAEARSRYKAGLTLYEDGAFDAARVQFERAYELNPSYRILYNVGLVRKQLNEFVGALNALERYLAEGGAEVPADRKAEVEKLISQLKGIVGSVNVQVNVPGAEITVDDAVVGVAPLEKPVLVNPGNRKIGAKAQGKLPDAKVITIASGDKPTVELTLGEAVVINQGTDVKPIIAWAVTGAFAVGAGTCMFLANNASNDREDLLAKRDVQRSEIDDATDKQKTLALVTDVLLIGTVISAGVAVYFTWFNSSGDDKADKKEKAASTTPKKPKAQVIPGVGSLLVRF
jgi:hypothetical protein